MVEVYHELAAIISVIALICTLLTLWVISKLKWNGFLLILTSLSVFQLFFDISFIFLFLSGEWSYSMYLLVDMFGEISVAIWTNILSLITLRIVVTLKTVNIYREYPVYLLLDVFVPIFLVIYSCVDHGINISGMDSAFRGFYWVRMFSVVFNIICYIVTAYLVSYLMKKVSSGILSTTQAQAITVLVSRMKYYSVVQVFLISGACWNGYNKDMMNNKASNYAYFLTAPACGIGYFLVFLYMQPLAMKLLVKSLGELPLIGVIFRPKNKDESIDDFMENGTARDSHTMEEQVMHRPSAMADLTDEELSRAIDIRYSATPKGVELSDVIRVASIRLDKDKHTTNTNTERMSNVTDDTSDRGSSMCSSISSTNNHSAIFTGFIQQRPQSIKMINEALERNKSTRIEPISSAVNNNDSSRPYSTNAMSSYIINNDNTNSTSVDISQKDREVSKSDYTPTYRTSVFDERDSNKDIQSVALVDVEDKGRNAFARRTLPQTPSGTVSSEECSPTLQPEVSNQETTHQAATVEWEAAEATVDNTNAYVNGEDNSIVNVLHELQTN